MATKDLRINRQIRAREVRLIDENGEQRGVMSTFEAYQLAEDAGLDLVEVSPNANPIKSFPMFPFCSNSLRR